MRQIIFDTETTGMNKGGHNVAEGHRIIEIGCVELVNRLPTGNHFHVYLKPDRSVDPEAVNVHGITDEFLADKPSFKEIAGQLWAYLNGADELIAHNMAFDQAFFDEEIRLLDGGSPLADRFHLIDSLEIARERHPGQRNNLDALCKRYNVDNRSRDLHGALLDAELLAEVYLRLTGGQNSLDLSMQAPSPQATAPGVIPEDQGSWVIASVSEAEQAEHQRILAEIGRQ
ncbi:DNA polymerase III subunit epsilon [Suttonella sp. R2A3]|uniref:DNA polymerase III subunit epsilon n=1 Tax=Suttonella sp. R2A3 TaxID=2908648 RepID=UPI001F4327EF|nr:DNA polymerase III subunit epsilon [Suttonella sp. R2A3]UJF24985.1 DNA polymerase III subunit epsilon [Suttonella sp. R2A3]